ncbi:MAG: competence/damage-inducible protein A [Acidobacteriota bacterium]|nr:competence/damage-inducible protein A [Acidobacteriota bacterium]
MSSAAANAEIIAVGSELLTPGKIDTNSLYLTGELNNLGVEVVRKMVVGDDRARLVQSIRDAAAQSQFVILSGGLGPTEDDLTRDAVAEALGRRLLFNQDICDWLEARFRSFGRKMAEVNKRQAYVVEGAEILHNDRGTAPGQWLAENGHILMLLPGPPRELKSMFGTLCLDRLRALLPPLAIRTRFYRVAGIGESDLDQIIAPIYTRYANPVTTILSTSGDIQIHLRARCSTEAEAEALLADLGGQIEAALGDRIYSNNGDPMEKVIGGLLREKKASLSVAESLTGGMLGMRITSVAGASDYFRGGFLTYTDEMKTTQLGVPREVLETQTAVSEPVATAMAAGARSRTGSTYALSLTGSAGPGGEDDGHVWIGLATPDGVEARELRFPAGDRDRVRLFATNTALNLLRRKLCAL